MILALVILGIIDPIGYILARSDGWDEYRWRCLIPFYWVKHYL